MEAKRIRLLISKVGLDGHDRGAKVVAHMLRNAGMEVVYLGLFETPESIVKTAVEEDVDVIGVSFLSGEHLTFTPQIVSQMKAAGLDDVLLILGGVIPAADVPALKEMGVGEVFAAGTLLQPIIDYIHAHVRSRIE